MFALGILKINYLLKKNKSSTENLTMDLKDTTLCCSYFIQELGWGRHQGNKPKKLPGAALNHQRHPGAPSPLKSNMWS